MTRESNEYTVRTFFQIVDSSDLGRLDDILSPDLTLHFTGVPEPLPLAGAMQLFGALVAAFPHPRHVIRCLETGDGRTVAAIDFHATHRGEFQGVPANGNAVNLPVTNSFRLDNGKIVEHWIELDMADLMRQIGAAPTVNGAALQAHRNGHSPTEANKAIVRRIYDELINQEKPAVIGEVFAANAVIHDPLSGTTHGAEAFAQLLNVFDTAFPHHRVSVEQVVAEGDMVSVLHIHYATHVGPFMGLPATGKSVVVNGVELFRLADGKVVEFWRKDDDVSLLMQLGAIPAPAAA